MGGMLSMLAYALLPLEPLHPDPSHPESGHPEPDRLQSVSPTPSYSEPDVIDGVTSLLLYGLAGPRAS
jgi:hypothetical protein